MGSYARLQHLLTSVSLEREQGKRRGRSSRHDPRQRPRRALAVPRRTPHLGRVHLLDLSADVVRKSDLCAPGVACRGRRNPRAVRDGEVERRLESDELLDLPGSTHRDGILPPGPTPMTRRTRSVLPTGNPWPRISSQAPDNGILGMLRAKSFEAGAWWCPCRVYPREIDHHPEGGSSVTAQRGCLEEGKGGPHRPRETGEPSTCFLHSTTRFLPRKRGRIGPRC